MSRAVRAVLFGLIATVLFGGCNAILGISEDPVVKREQAGCLLKSDCSGNEICLFRVCSPPCQADQDCNRDRGERCLRTAEGAACVRDALTTCTGEPSCPDGTRCAAGKCFSDCDGSRESCLKDQTCENDKVCRGGPRVDAGEPGREAAPRDAAGTPPDATTEGGGPPPACSPEESVRCEGSAQSARSICRDGVWTATEPCADGKLCDTASPVSACTTVDPLCFGRKPNESFCDGALRVVCGPDLVTTRTTQCESPQHCGAVTDGCAACLDNDFTCDGNRLLKCKLDHTGFDVFKTCGGASPPCNAQAGDCTNDACSTNQKRCSGDRLEQCNATRSAFTLLETCGAGLCDSTAFECDTCLTGSATCVGGKVHTCADDGRTQVEEPCPSARPNCTGEGQCVACLDAGDCTAPSDCTGKTCNAGACGFPPIGRSISCSGGVCDGSGNCVQCLSAAQCTAPGECFNATCGGNQKCAFPPKNAGDACGGGFCDGAGVCKACLNSSHCAGNKPICVSGACVACSSGAQCAAKATGLDQCRTATGACVGCLTSTQCSTATTPICDPASFTCRGCTQASPPTAGDAECNARNGNAARACRNGGSCGACTATNALACTGTTPLCNAATNTCVGCLTSATCGTGATPICSGNTCSACTTNAECTAKGNGLNFCKAGGTCVACLPGTCAGGQVCTASNTCCTPDTRNEACGQSTCGTAGDGCGTQTFTCGTCSPISHCCSQPNGADQCQNQPCGS